MFWWVILLEALVFAVLFTAILFACFHGERRFCPAAPVGLLVALVR